MEVGQYVGNEGAGETHAEVDERGEPRRVIARRYEGRRFASAFLVEEHKLSPEEEREESGIDKPVYF